MRFHPRLHSSRRNYRRAQLLRMRDHRTRPAALQMLLNQRALLRRQCSRNVGVQQFQAGMQVRYQRFPMLEANTFPFAVIRFHRS